VVDEIDLETLFKIKQMDEGPLQIIEDQLAEEFNKFNIDIDTQQDVVPHQDLSDDQFSVNLQRFIESRMVTGVSPTGNVYTNQQDTDTAKSNKGKSF